MDIEKFFKQTYIQEDEKLFNCIIDDKYDKDTAIASTIRWNKVKKLGEDKNFIKHQFKDFCKRYNFKKESDVVNYLKNIKYILEVGAGEGRLVDWYLKYSNAIIFALEISDSVYYLNNKYKNEKRVIIVKADISNNPFNERVFDLISLDQTIHHILNPEDSFYKLISSLKKDGKILLSVFSKKSPIREKFDILIRELIAQQPNEKRYEISKKITEIGKILSEINLKIKIPKDWHEFGNLCGKTFSFQRFFYYAIMKCFWNKKYSKEKNIEINFDWYNYPICKKFSLDEVIKWFIDWNFLVEYIDSNESNINIRATLKS